MNHKSIRYYWVSAPETKAARGWTLTAGSMCGIPFMRRPRKNKRENRLCRDHRRDRASVSVILKLTSHTTSRRTGFIADESESELSAGDIKNKTASTKNKNASQRESSSQWTRFHSAAYYVAVMIHCKCADSSTIESDLLQTPLQYLEILPMVVSQAIIVKFNAVLAVTHIEVGHGQGYTTNKRVLSTPACADTSIATLRWDKHVVYCAFEVRRLAMPRILSVALWGIVRAQLACLHYGRGQSSANAGSLSSSAPQCGNKVHRCAADNTPLQSYYHSMQLSRIPPKDGIKSAADTDYEMHSIQLACSCNKLASYQYNFNICEIT